MSPGSQLGQQNAIDSIQSNKINLNILHQHLWFDLKIGPSSHTASIIDNYPNIQMLKLLEESLKTVDCFIISQISCCVFDIHLFVSLTELFTNTIYFLFITTYQQKIKTKLG